MILGIFFARFFPEEGTRVVHQSPPGCIVAEPDLDKPRFFDFDVMAEYIIPRQAFCNRYVAMFDPENKYQILGHPVCIKDKKYPRNEFIFNFCLVIGIETDKIPYEAVVRRLASSFTEMETQNQYLSQEDDSNSQDKRSIAALLEIIKEDLNNYNECMIPVDDANTINMKLFPLYGHPPPVKLYHVPISGTDFIPITDDTWDLTLRKVISEIDGIKDVRRIASVANVAPHLAKVALQHLLYYESILLLDLFLFGNIYAPTPELSAFVKDKDGMQDECAEYVYINGPRLPNFWLVRLFTSLTTSRTVKEWLKLHMDQGFPVLNYVDVRRFIQFGLIKTLLYRVHKHAVSEKKLRNLSIEEAGRAVNGYGGGDAFGGVDEGMRKYADGCYVFDQIMAERNLGDVGIMDRFRKFPKGDVEVFYR